MTLKSGAVRWGASILAVVLAAGGAGYWAGHRDTPQAQPAAAAGTGKVLYYYDPMFPNQKFDKPGKSPFMDMQLVAKYADGAAASAAPAVTVDPSARQSLGLRVVEAKMGSLASTLDVTGTIDFNQRDVAIIQARSGGFVSRVYARAPGDVVRAGAPIADLLLPEWGGAQTEYLSVRRLGRPELTAAARQRLRLLGMSDGLIASVERTGRPNGVVTITTPISGVIQTLDARAGVTLVMGQTLAQVNGLGTVWLNAAVPEARAGDGASFVPEPVDHHFLVHPIFSLQGQEGRLFAPLAFTKTYAMAAAAILSITLVPVLMGWLIRGRIPGEESNPVNRWLARAYPCAAASAI